MGKKFFKNAKQRTRSDQVFDSGNGHIGITPRITRLSRQKSRDKNQKNKEECVAITHAYRIMTLCVTVLSCD